MSLTTNGPPANADPVPVSLDHSPVPPCQLQSIGDGADYVVVRSPKLPVCFTRIDNLEEAIPTARNIRSGRVAIALTDGERLPLPSQARPRGAGDNP